MIMLRNMFYVFKYHASALYVCMFMCHGGRFPDDLMYRTVLFVSRRVGDVTMKIFKHIELTFTSYEARMIRIKVIQA